LSFLKTIRRVIEDPAPAYAFEISPGGIAFSHRVKKETEVGFRPLEPDVLAISPLKNNVVQPDSFFERVRSLAPENGKNGGRGAALILPDYCTRVAVLDFDDFPSEKAEQNSLVRFRMKKSIPFDLESAQVSFRVQPGRTKKYEVVAVATVLEIVARYEAAFRRAGFQTGFVTTSMLAALNLLPDDGVLVTAKLGGSVLTVTVTDGQNLRLLRCLELPEVNLDEITAVLYPTLAYVEDELDAKALSLRVCGFGKLTPALIVVGRAEMGVPVEKLQSRLGEPDETNAGLLGFLEAMGE
jgi:type IV pilus assembly protein PilM